MEEVEVEVEVSIISHPIHFGNRKSDECILDVISRGQVGGCTLFALRKPW